MDWTLYLRFAAALVFVLGLIGLFTWVARRAGWMPGQPSRRGPESRLAVLEARALDPKRRLVLVRRDDEEHLILLGVGSDVVIERNIHRTPALGAKR